MKWESIGFALARRRVRIILSVMILGDWLDLDKLRSSVGQLAWPLFHGVLVAASVLFFRADRRYHTWFLLIGSGLVLFLDLTEGVDWTAGGSHDGETMIAYLGGTFSSPIDHYRRIAEMIAWGLFSYGLLMTAFIQFNLSRNSPVSRE